MPRDRTNSLILGLALIGGGMVMIAIFVALAFPVDTGNGGYFRNASSSMEPTILNGDYIATRNLSVGRDPGVIHRGDIVVHAFPPDPAKSFTNRVIGLPGDTLAMKDGVVLVDGRTLREAYTQHVDSTDPVTSDFTRQRAYLAGAAMRDSAHDEPSRDNWGPLVVPRGQFFVLGDNRTRSLDSRYFGFVAANQVLARVRRIYFSRDDSTGQIRWSRIGHLMH
jgi:signal peptidase I